MLIMESDISILGRLPEAELYRSVFFSTANTSAWRDTPQTSFLASQYTGSFSRSQA